MQYVTCPPAAAVGHVARTNISNHSGQRIVAKGHRLTAYDVTRLIDEHIAFVDIVIADADEVDENHAAAHVARHTVGSGVQIAAAHHGRADIHASHAGVVRIDIDALIRANHNPTQTVATIRDGQVVQAGQRVASVKILPFAVPQHELPVHHTSVVRVLPFVRRRVGVLVVGAVATYERIRQSHLPPLRERLALLDAAVTREHTCLAAARDVGHALRTLAVHCDLLISISETSVMGVAEAIPAGVSAAGGQIIRHGAPVEPGNMMLVGSIDKVPFLAAPGCIRNPARNVVDLLLPRLIADDIPDAAAITAWAHGGLLGGKHD
jgi:molybdenum cofactor cytidylyltransferase